MWGEFSDLPFALACAREPEHVSDAERRAIELMRSLVDDERFLFYVATGLIYARGNLTGITYRLEHGKGHGAGVYELRDGETVASYCIAPTDKVPDSDHVLAVKNMIEGEEAVFRMTGNRSGWNLEPHRHHHDEGTFRNFAAPRALPKWETSICGTLDSIEERDILGVMVYRDTYFQPYAEMDKEQFGMKENDDLLTSPFVHVYDLDFDPYKRKKVCVTDPAFDGISLHVCRTNDLYPYEGNRDIIYPGDDRRNYNPVNYPGPRLEDQNAVARFNHALQVGGRVIDIAAPDCMGLCLNNAGASYHQGFADGMDAARTRRHARCEPLPLNYPLPGDYQAFGQGDYVAPMNFGTGTITCGASAYYTLDRQEKFDHVGERTVTTLQEQLVGAYIALMEMTGPHDDPQTARYKQAMEVEL